jgi:hypothetical protein
MDGALGEAGIDRDGGGGGKSFTHNKLLFDACRLKLNIKIRKKNLEI